MAIKIIPYNKASKSAKALSEVLNAKRLRREGSRYRAKKGDFIINWGCSALPGDLEARTKNGIILNAPAAVGAAANKLKSFEAFKRAGVSIPEYTTSKEKAKEMLLDGEVVCRTVLNGHSGEGIVIAGSVDDLVDAPMYTKYVKKTHEYRVHVMDGEAFFVQRKARKREVEDEKVNWKIRNLAGGFIFAHKDIEVPEGMCELAQKAVEALELDFGAVDIIVTKQGHMYVLEVNTACGLEGTTLEKYKTAFLEGQW